jgi:hypothetical protein
MFTHIVSPPTGGHSTHRRTAPERRLLAPRRIGVPGVLVAIDRRVGRFIDAHEARMVGIAARDRMVLELAEMASERDMLGTRDVLITEEQDPVLEQQGADFRDEPGIARGDAQIHVGQLGANRAGERLDLDRRGVDCWGGNSGHDLIFRLPVTFTALPPGSTSPWSCETRDRGAPAPRSSACSAA